MNRWGLTIVTWSGGTRVPRGVVIDPQLRGRITPRIVAGLALRGLHVHQVGGAAYVHDDVGDVAIITAVLERRATRPRWVAELDAGHRYLRGRGRPTRRQALMLEAAGRAWRRMRLRDQRTGQFVGRPAWWQREDGSPAPGLLAPTGRPPRATGPVRPWCPVPSVRGVDR